MSLCKVGELRVGLAQNMLVKFGPGVSVWMHSSSHSLPIKVHLCVGMASIKNKMIENSLRWFGYVQQK